MLFPHGYISRTEGTFPVGLWKGVADHKQDETKFPVDKKQAHFQNEQQDMLGGLGNGVEFADWALRKFLGWDGLALAHGFIICVILFIWVLGLLIDTIVMGLVYGAMCVGVWLRVILN